MAKNTQKKGKNNDITFTKIHEFIRSTQFSEDLFYDIMSDIKEKPSYKRLKAMIDDLISKNMDTWASIPVNPSESERRKSIISEISLTAFTVDAVFPVMIYRHLQSKFSDIVQDICKQVNEEKMNGNASIPEFQNRENSAETSHKSVNKNVAHTVSNGETSKKVSPKRGRGRPRKKPVVSVEVHSDAESVASLGNLSLPSVSSVHTSELSSFDDEISLSSEDDEESGKKKRKLSLNAIKEIYQEGRISAWCAANLNSKSSTKRTEDNTDSEPVEKVVQETKVSPDEGTSSPTSTSGQSSLQKTLPQRIRKPNFKYSSDSIYCPITAKQKKVKRVNGTDDKTAVSSSPKGKRKKIKENDEAKSPKSMQEKLCNDERKDAVSAITPSQQKSSDFFKPHSAIRSLTSRKTAPVTLYSTVAQNIK